MAAAEEEEVIDELLDLRLQRLNENLPCDVIRVGNRQGVALDRWAREAMAWSKLPPHTPLERIMGMRVEYVESPDYLEIA